MFVRESSTNYSNIFNNEQSDKINIFAYKDKISILKDFIFKVWNLKEPKGYDSNFEWLISNGYSNILFRYVNTYKQYWLADEAFCDFLRNVHFYDITNFKENFLLEACLLKKEFEFDKNMEWIIRNGSLVNIKKLLVHNFAYPEEVLEKIYTALFPLNKRNTIIRIANESESAKRIINMINNEFSELFIKECQILISDLTKRESSKKETHAATDLASFTFCPASYAICQTYTIDIREQETIYTGNQEHERQRLLNLSNKHIIIERQREIISPNFHIDFKRILNAECVSQGHGTTNPTVYYTRKKKLAGIPDYIFQDNNGCFAVEEKYTTKKYEEFTDYYDNHKIQALVYLYLYESNKYKFDEVYLLYWFIRKDDYGQYNVYNYKLFKFIRTDDNGEQILNVFEKLESIQSRVPYPFPPSEINYRKCIKCSYFPFCKYKKGNDHFIELTPISNTNNQNE